MTEPYWRYRIKVFAPENQGGGLLIETVHTSESSRDIEIMACQAWMARGEVAHIEVIIHVEPYSTQVIAS